MSPEEKLARAAQILKEQRVNESLNYLLDSPWFHDVPGLYVERDTSVKTQRGHRLFSMRLDYRGDRFELAETDIIPPMEYNEPTYSELTVRFNGEDVLATTMMTHAGSWSKREVAGYATWIKLFRPGMWMQGLADMCDLCRETWGLRKAASEKEERERMASNIELGDYE